MVGLCTYLGGANKNGNSNGATQMLRNEEE